MSIESTESVCPNCGAARIDDAPFCARCGWEYATGAGEGVRRAGENRLRALMWNRVIILAFFSIAAGYLLLQEPAGSNPVYQATIIAAVGVAIVLSWKLAQRLYRNARV